MFTILHIAIRDIDFKEVYMKKHNGMKPQDVVILLYICCLKDEFWKIGDVANYLHISQSEVSESLNRSRLARLIDSKKKLVYRDSLFEFIVHGLKYVFPGVPGATVRGVLTSHSAPPLSDMVMEGEEQYVWRFSKGNVRGMEIEPLYKTVPEVAIKNRAFYELVSLVDVIRVGRAREVNLAIEELKKRLICENC